MLHKLCILDPTGHTEHSWDDDGGGLAVAEKAFAREVGERKSAAFATGPAGTRKIGSLKDLKLGEDAVIVPQLQGG